MLNHYTMPEQKMNRKYIPLVVFSLYKPRKQRNKINILQVSGIKVWHHAGKTSQAYFSLKRGKYKYIYCKKKPSSFPSIA
jgi:hypothetical protein